MVWNLRSHGETDGRKETEYLQSGGLAWTIKPKASPAQARAKASKSKARAKASLARVNARARTNRRVNNTARGKNGFLEMPEREDTQETQTRQKYTEWTDTIWDHADSWTDADWCSSDWSQICEMTLHGNKRHDSCQRRSRLKNSPIQLMEEAFQC